MALKSKSKKSAAPETLKKSGKQTGRRKQLLPELPHTYTCELSGKEDELSLTVMMNLLVDINTHLSTNEQCLDHLSAKRAAEQGSRDATRRG